LDGWSVPWHARLFRLVHTHWFANKINFVEREPYGIKDSRLRQMVKDALFSGDPSQAGLFSTPGGPMLELRRLVKVVLKELGSITQPALILHPREDDRSSIRNSFHLQRKLGGLVDMVVLDDSYHIITVDRQRDIVVGRSVSFTSWLAERRQRSLENERLRRAAEGEVPAERKSGSGSQRAVA
jgi:carboxylesterase